MAKLVVCSLAFLFVLQTTLSMRIHVQIFLFKTLNHEYDSQEQVFQRSDHGDLSVSIARVSDIKKGGFVMLKGNPCMVTQISIAKKGKHGSYKASIFGNDLFTNNKYEETMATDHTVLVPNVEKNIFQCISISEDETATLRNRDDESELLSLKLPSRDTDEKLHDELLELYNNRGNQKVLFQVRQWADKKKIVSGRTSPN